MGLEGRVAGAEGAVRAAGALLAGWGSMLARRMAEGEVVDEATREQLREEIRAAEANVHG